MPTNSSSAPIMSPRRQRTRDLMIQTILDTARIIMREDGVAALSMQELARRLDMRAPSLYNYFSSKKDIYNVLFRLGFTLFDEYLEKTGQGAPSWQVELRRIFEAYMTFAMENPDLYQLCFERPVPGFEPSEESLKVSFGMLQKSYERSVRLHTVIDTDLSPEQTADLFIAMMHGLTALHLANEPQLPVGAGRFGSLIPAALSVLDKAWSKH
ncbi:MAG: TetR/AcrR family transcriptional regulator [Chloroflexi bacterium]|nr:TetR/AcrR family transcriptional regulator [Chloroflexota bacterium]